MASVVQRRLGTILAADIVGYGPFAGGDDHDTLAALRAHREAIDPVLLQEGGRFVKSDNAGLLLEFPNALYAARASLGVQRLMAERNAGIPADRRLAVRMGIHRGDVIVEDDDMSGDGISIAERLQEIADPGGVCLSGAAHAAVHKDIDRLFADGGAKPLRDVAVPVQIYSLARDALSELTITAPRHLLSLIVLPFANATGEARHDFLTDSITEQLTNELARIADSFVIDRKTALAYRGGDIPEATELGRTLGIRYAIKGSAAAFDDGLRLSVQLIDATNGQTIWGESFDIDIGDPFMMQNTANSRLVPPLYANLIAAHGRAPQSAPASTSEPTRTAQILPLVVRSSVTAAPMSPEASEPPPPRRIPPFPEPRLSLQLRSSDDENAQPALVPPMVIHPRLIFAPTAMAELSPAAPATPQSSSSIVEMPTPPLFHGVAEGRIPLLLRAILTLAVAAAAGGVAAMLLGIQPNTLVEIGSWALIAAGVFQLACAVIEWSLPKPARSPKRESAPDANASQIAPLGTLAIDTYESTANRTARTARRVVVTDVFRSRPDIFDSRRRVPRR